MSSSRRRKPLVTRKVMSDDEESTDNSRMANGDGDEEKEEEDIPDDLPEGTVVVEPEAVEESSFKGPEFPSNKKKVLEATGYIATVYCTACGEQINTSKKGDARRHPELNVLICRRCYKFHTSGPIEKDEDGLDEHCRWCSEGGNLFGCDYCHNAFCQSCIKRNLGRAEFSRVKDAEKFKCYVCNPKPLAAMVEHCNSVIDTIDKEFQKLNDSTKKKKEVEKQKSSIKSEKSTPNTQDKSKSLVIKLPAITTKQTPNTSTPKPKETPTPATVTTTSTTTTQGKRVLLPYLPGRPSYSSLAQQLNAKPDQNKQNIIYVETQKGSAKQLVYIQPKQPQHSIIPPTQQPRDPINWTNVNVRNAPFITDQLIQCTTDLLNLLRSLRSNIQGPNNSLSIIASEGRKTAISCMKSGVDIFLGQLSSIAGTNIVQADKMPDPVSANPVSANPVSANAQNLPSQSTTVKLTGGNSSVISTSAKDLITLDSENDDSQTEVVDITDSSEKDKEEDINLEKDKKSKDSSQENNRVDDKKEDNMKKEEEKEDSSDSKTNKMSNDTKESDNVTTETENDAAHLELLHELQELSGTVDPNDSVTKQDEENNEETNKDLDNSKELEGKKIDEKDEDNEKSNTKKDKSDEKSDVKKDKDKEKSNTKKDKSDEKSDVKKDKNNEKSDAKKDKNNEKSDVKKAKNDNKKVDSENNGKLSKKNDKSESKKDEDSETENVTDESDSSSSSSESDVSTDNSKDSDFDIKSERKTRRSLKEDANKSKFKELRKKRKAREKEAKKKEGKEKKRSKSKEENASKSKNEKGKKKRKGSDESDFNDDLEDEIEKLEKDVVLKKGKKKEKKEREDDEEGKKTKEEKKKTEEKQKKGKKNLNLDDLSSTEEVSNDEDNAEDKKENEDVDVPMDQDDDETEEENNEDEIVEDSSDSEITLSPRKKKAALEKRKADKKKNDSNSDTEEEDVPKKKKLRSSLLDAKLSDSESDFQPSKKSKKRKADSSVEESSKSSDSEKEFIALGKKSKKKGKANQKKKDGTGKRRKRIKKVESSDDEENQTEAESDELEDMKKKKKRRKKKGEEDSEGEKEDGEDASPSKGGRKDIRKLISSKKLKDETKAASKAEEERRERIAEKQKKYNNIIQVVDESSPTKAPVTKQLILERDEKGEPVLEVDKDLVTKLKPHQVEAVEFMWNCTVESLKMLKDEKEEGAGCILAHCMGLGKTLSVISFLHTMMGNYETTGFSTALIVCPLNTVLNWQNEVNMWLEDNEVQLEVFELASVKVNESRAKLLEEWHEDGGIMIVGYEMFRNLSQGNNCRKKKLKESFKKTLVDPGPDFVVCDEGHILKNDSSALSKAMNQIKTRRRIVLTGTPLQNNLIEYHCMVSFVKPNLLGTRKEFLNRFVNPITNGQCTDSSAHDVRVMKRRAHVLHEKLAGCVQRKDYSALTKYLPPKNEYVISVRLCKIQCDLYNKYLEMGGMTFGGEMIKSKGAKLFSDYQALMRIWTHPWVLKMDEIRQEIKNMIDDEESFITSESGSNSESDAKSSGSGSDSDKSMSFNDSDSENDEKKDKKQKGKKSTEEEPVKESFAGEIVKKWKTRSRGEYNDGDFPIEDDVKQPFSTGWFTEFVKEEDQFRIELSGKLVLLFEILRMCEEIGDKVLVFSQSLLSLDLIEAFLEHVDKEYDESLNKEKNGDEKDKNEDGKDKDDKDKDNTDKDKKNSLPDEIFGKRWLEGQDYLRMDGSTGAPQRSAMAKNFNDPENYRLRLFLISTKAGGLGINLVGANRVIIFDASWNPSHDVQSIFRVYRFGQDKPVYVYRFLAQGTMEEKIYERQVTKQSLSQRVIDEHQIDRHFNSNDLRELYNFKPDRLDDPNRKERPTPALPKDTLLAELLTEKKEWIVTYHEHDSLLENKTEEVLTEEERKAAWEDFENERKGLMNTVRNTFMGQMPSNMGFSPYAFGNPNMMASQMSPQLNQENLLRIVQEMKQKFPHLPQEQLTMQVQNVIRNMISRQIQQQQWEQRRQIEQRELQQQQQLQQIQARIMQQQNQLRMQQAVRPPLGMNMPLSNIQPQPGSSSSLLAQTLTNGAQGKSQPKKS